MFSQSLKAYDIKAKVTGAHTLKVEPTALRSFDGIAVGGGNTFRLLYWLRKNDWMLQIQDMVSNGIPYFGSSAGSNVGTRNIKASNDMTIVDPGSLDALGLVPFIFNAHYLPGEGQQNQESRDTRLTELQEENPDLCIFGPMEGGWGWMENGVFSHRGNKPALVAVPGEEWQMVEPGTDISWLLTKQDELAEAYAKERLAKMVA